MQVAMKTQNAIQFHFFAEIKKKQNRIVMKC